MRDQEEDVEVYRVRVRVSFSMKKRDDTWSELNSRRSQSEVYTVWCRVVEHGERNDKAIRLPHLVLCNLNPISSPPAPHQVSTGLYKMRKKKKNAV